MDHQKLKMFYQALGIEVVCRPESGTEALGIATTVPTWFWESTKRNTLHFERYDRPKSRELAEYLWQGKDPDFFSPEKTVFFFGEVSPPDPARLAYFAILDSLALISWRSASQELRGKWVDAVKAHTRLETDLTGTIPMDAFAHRLWAVAWRWLGHRDYEWMEHQLSTVAPETREFAGTMLVQLIPELQSTSPLWEAIRYGLIQDATFLYTHLQKEFNAVEPLAARDVKKRMDRQVKLREVFSRFSAICSDCAAGGGSCCSRDIPHYYFAKADLSYLKGAGVTLPNFDPACASANSCIFIGRNGCRFPADLRPAVCLSHTCDAIYYGLSPKEKSLLTHFELRRLMTIRDTD